MARPATGRGDDEARRFPLPSPRQKRLQLDVRRGKRGGSGRAPLGDQHFREPDVPATALPGPMPLAASSRPSGARWNRMKAPSPRSRRTMLLGAVGQAGDLQGEVVLIRPEPRHGRDGLGGPEHVAGGERALVLRIAPGFQPDAAAAIDRQRERAAVAGGENVRVAGLQEIVDGDAVVERQARRSRPAR